MVEKKTFSLIWLLFLVSVVMFTLYNIFSKFEWVNQLGFNVLRAGADIRIL